MRTPVLIFLSFFVYVSSFFRFFRDVAFSEYFCTMFTVFSLYGEYCTSYVSLFQMIFFFYLVSTGWIFDIILFMEMELVIARPFPKVGAYAVT